jgi:hypothetical protein
MLDETLNWKGLIGAPSIRGLEVQGGSSAQITDRAVYITPLTLYNIFSKLGE